MSTGKLPSLVILTREIVHFKTGKEDSLGSQRRFSCVEEEISMVKRPNLIRATSAGVPTKAALPPAVIPVQI